MLHRLQQTSRSVKKVKSSTMRINISKGAKLMGWTRDGIYESALIRRLKKFFFSEVSDVIKKLTVPYGVMIFSPTCLLGNIYKYSGQAVSHTERAEDSI